MVDLLQRDEELIQLDEAVQRAAAGAGLVVLIRGEAGIGKSTILGQFVSHSRDQAHVLVGRCDDLITPTSLAAFWDMTDEEPDLRNPLEAGDSRALSQSVLELLSRSLRPTIVAIDDIHWADQATLDVVKRTGRRIAETHGLLVLTFRDEETTSEHPLRAVIGDIPARSTLRIRLKPLTRESIAQLAGSDRGDELFRLTGGNPLLVSEAIDSADEVPQSVADATMTRLGRLGAEARAIVELVSVVPGLCERDVAEACLPFTSAALDEGEGSGLLVVSPGYVSFRHELIRRAVEVSLTAVRRIELNVRLLECLRQHGDDPARLVHHAREAGDVNAIIEYAPIAARDSARAGGHREAVAFFGVLEPHLESFDPRQRARLLEAWSSSNEELGDIAAARELTMKAESIYREVGTSASLGTCLSTLSRLHWRMVHPDQAFESANEAVALLSTSETRYELACALTRRALLNCVASRFPQARKDIAAAEGINGDVSDMTLAARLAAVEAWTAYSAKDSFEIAMGALALAEQAQDLQAADITYALVAQVVPELHPDRWDEILRDGLTVAEENGLDDLRAFIQFGLSRQHLYAGLFVPAEDEARVAGEIWSDSRQNLAVVPVSMVALAQMRRGGANASQSLSRLSEIGAGPPEVWGVSQVLAEAHWLYGDSSFDVQPALDELEFAITTGGADVYISELSFWLWRLGLLKDVSERIHIGFRHQMEGDWEAATDVWRNWQRPYHQALALYDGDTEARIAALSILDEIGAVPLATRIRTELRKAGVTGIPLGPRPTTRDNAGRLTERQAEVVELMAEELSNTEIADRLFISSRTVEHHVSAILSKLDVTSREQAVEEARHLGVLSAV